MNQHKKQPPTREEISKCKAVIFDMDGTLVDSMWMWYQIDVEYLGRFGIEPPEDLQTAIEGMSFSETAVHFKERFQIPDSLDQIKADWNAMAAEKYRREVPFKAGAEEFLQWCKAQGIRLGVATSNSRQLVDCVSEALPLKEYMDQIITACEVAHGKPAPDVYLEAAKRLGVAPEECMVFEDLPAGILAGQAAGMKVCAVEDAYSKDIWEKKAELAEYYIDDYTQIR
ncbi:MAG: HAD family phosphatase [Eubacteriales bacterium]|nr:HAD family phosphatase [Eubacteriales bacterium]